MPRKAAVVALNEVQKKIVEKNHNLIYHCIKELHISLDEYYSYGAEGLCRAALRYDVLKGKFSTYACNAIKYTIFAQMRCSNNYRNTRNRENLSYEAFIGDNDNDFKYFMRDVNSFDPCDVSVVNDIYDYIETFAERDKHIMLMYIAGYTQEEIGKVYGITQRSISIVITRLRAKIRQFYEGA